jgi:two-component system, NtrC family, response regulator HydG
MSACFNAPIGLDEVKKQRLIQALREAGGNQSEAAKLLGISRTRVWNQMRRFNLGAKPGDKK